MKRTIAILSTFALIGGATTFVVASDRSTERPVVAADETDSRSHADRASRNGNRVALPTKPLADAKRSSMENLRQNREDQIAEKKRKAEEKKKRVAAAEAERAEKQPEQNTEPSENKTEPESPPQNYTAPGGIAACIRKYESGGNYQALNPSSGASGAYQFMDGTWQAVTGLPGKAMNYSPAQQDAAFWELWDGGSGSSHWVTAPMCGY